MYNDDRRNDVLYTLEVQDLVANSWVLVQTLPKGEETEVYLPYTQQVRVGLNRAYSPALSKVYNVSSVNVYSVSIDTYVNKYTNSTDQLKVHRDAL